MYDRKEDVKKLLPVFRIYAPVHRLWVQRPNVRVVCWNAGYRLAGAGDNLPLPPTRLIYLVTISKEISWFLHTGKISHDSILYVLQRNDLHVEDFSTILDFGCGCGRVIRYWHSVKGPHIFGTDYNPELIKWCQRKLSNLADFKINGLNPPLDYVDEKFDFIYAISVYTHLSEDLQQAWMHEHSRVLKKRGLLLITLHGDSRLFELSPEEQKRYYSGQLVVKYPELAGSNYCGAYHPRSYVHDHMVHGFDIIDYVPEGARDANQDIYLLRKQ